MPLLNSLELTKCGTYVLELKSLIHCGGDKVFQFYEIPFSRGLIFYDDDDGDAMEPRPPFLV